MKKILLFAAAMLALAGCKDPNGATSSASDDITVAPENRTVGGDGGNVQVTGLSHPKTARHMTGLLQTRLPELTETS